MSSTDTKNLKFLTVMKAILLLTTLWFGLASFDLPNVNTPIIEGGKIIKADGISTLYLFPPDSSKYEIVPEFRMTDPGKYQINTVVIDPGHGGHDPGCLGHNSREKHIVLAIGNHLAAGIKAQFPELNVIMTRSTDVFLPLHERASIATESKADLFISIHCNAFSKPDAMGTETYVLGLHATKENLEVAKRENEAILLEDNYQQNYGYDPNSPEAHILFSMFQNAFLDQSIAFAEKVQKQAHNQTKRKNRGVKQAGFLVLRYATMPSVLIETAYLTNSSDENFLMSEDGQKKMANSIQDAFADYKREMERAGFESASTVSYVEVNNMSSISSTSKPENLSSKKGKIAVPRRETTAPIIGLNLEEEEKKAKRWGLEISPPTSLPPSANNTNTSPKKASKIVPNLPMDEPISTTVKAEKPSKKEPIKVEPKKPDINSNVQFCVQLAASPSPINVRSGKWTRMNQTVEVVKEANLYKYQVRNFSTLEEANHVKSGLRAKGFNDAFVVAYKDGIKVDPRKL